MYRLRTPISEDSVRKLRIGDFVFVSGTIFTMRDRAHERALEYEKRGEHLPVAVEGAVLYHCGPLVRRWRNGWKVVAAGPTTSSRMEPFEAKLIEKFRVRMIVGKGGMGALTMKALKKYGAVYCDFPGGAAVVAATAVKKIIDVKWLDLGLPEAVWVFKVENFGPLIVTMDSYGRNLRSTDFLLKTLNERC